MNVADRWDRLGRQMGQIDDDGETGGAESWSR